MTFYEVTWVLFSRIIRVLFRIKCTGSENLPGSGPVILCCNHRANYDPILLGAVLTRPLFFMAKAELFKVPGLRWLIRKLGAFPVNRGKGDIDAIKKSLKILKEEKTLAMFPEGHRLIEGGEPRRFKSGVASFAHKTGALILPAAIVCSGKMHVLKKKRIVIGKPVTAADIGITDGSPENIAQASENLRKIIVLLMATES